VLETASALTVPAHDHKVEEGVDSHWLPLPPTFHPPTLLNTVLRTPVVPSLVILIACHVIFIVVVEWHDWQLCV
jgi:hypothetical protein